MRRSRRIKRRRKIKRMRMRRGVEDEDEDEEEEKIIRNIIIITRYDNNLNNKKK